MEGSEAVQPLISSIVPSERFVKPANQLAFQADSGFGALWGKSLPTKAPFADREAAPRLCAGFDWGGAASFSYFQVSRNHCGSRANAELCEDAAQVRTNGPGTDVENRGDDLIRVSLGNHTHDFLLARTELYQRGRGPSSTNQYVPPAIEFSVHQDLFRITLRLVPRQGCAALREPFHEGTEYVPQRYFNLIDRGGVRTDQAWLGRHNSGSCGAIGGKRPRRAESTFAARQLEGLRKDSKPARKIPVPLSSDTCLAELNRASLSASRHDRATSNWLPGKCD